MSESAKFSLPQPAYRLQVEDIATHLNTDLEGGLSNEEAKKRHQISGDNALPGIGGVSILKVLFKQVANALTLVYISVIPCIY
jgi:magnesium-transporting ATPase (P-type)